MSGAFFNANARMDGVIKKSPYTTRCEAFYRIDSSTGAA